MTEKQIDRYCAQKACDLFNMASYWDLKTIKESIDETKEFMKVVYAKAYDDGFAQGFEDGVKQELGL
jgi:hypothetical protein